MSNHIKILVVRKTCLCKIIVCIIICSICDSDKLSVQHVAEFNVKFA